MCLASSALKLSKPLYRNLVMRIYWVHVCEHLWVAAAATWLRFIPRRVSQGEILFQTSSVTAAEPVWLLYATQHISSLRAQLKLNHNRHMPNTNLHLTIAKTASSKTEAQSLHLNQVALFLNVSPKANRDTFLLWHGLLWADYFCSQTWTHTQAHAHFSLFRVPG